MAAAVLSGDDDDDDDDDDEGGGGGGGVGSAGGDKSAPAKGATLALSSFKCSKRAERPSVLIGRTAPRKPFLQSE
jgi:hypothetical protein